MAIGIKKKKYQSQPTGRAPTLEEEQDSVLAEMAHQIAAGMEPQPAFRPRVPGGELTLPDTEADWMTPGSRERLAAAMNRPAEIKPGMAAPGRVPMNLSPEEAAAIDAEAGIGAPMALRDPLNPRAGGLPIGILRSQPQPGPEQLQAAQDAALNMREEAEQFGGVMELPDYGNPATARGNFERQRGLRNNLRYKAMVDANRQVGDLLASGAITAADVRSPDSPYYTPPMSVANANPRSEADQLAMADKHDAYRQRLADDEAMRRENLQRKIALRGMSPRERMAERVIGLMGSNGGSVNPLAIGILTGDPRAAQVAADMAKTQANQSLAQAELGQRDSQFQQKLGLDRENLGFQRESAAESGRRFGEEMAFKDKQLTSQENEGRLNRESNERAAAAEAAARSQQAKDKFAQDKATEWMKEKAAQMAAGKPEEEAELIATSKYGEPTVMFDEQEVTAELGRGDMAGQQRQQKKPPINIGISDLLAAEGTTPDSFFTRFPAQQYGGELEAMEPSIRKRFGDSAIQEYVQDNPFFSTQDATSRNQLAGIFDMPQTSSPWIGRLGVGGPVMAPDNYNAQDDFFNPAAMLAKLMVNLGLKPDAFFGPRADPASLPFAPRGR